jgi:hypothetical protein
MLEKEEIKKDIVKKREKFRVEYEKSRVLFAGVTFFMVLIIFLWVMSLGAILRPIHGPQNNFQLKQFSQELKQSLDKVTVKINELKKIDAADLEKFKQENSGFLQMVATSSTSTVPSVEK